MAKVIVANKLPQVVRISLNEPDGSVSELVLKANASSEPIEADAISDHTRQLAAAGRIKLRPA